MTLTIPHVLALNVSPVAAAVIALVLLLVLLRKGRR